MAEQLQRDAECWSKSERSKTGQLPVIVGYFQSKLLEEAISRGYDPSKLVLFASHKLPRHNGGKSMLTFAARDRETRNKFVKSVGLTSWYYYSQPPNILGMGTEVRPVRLYLDLDAHDSGGKEGFSELESFARNTLFTRLCDFLKVPEKQRMCLLSTNHKVKEDRFKGSVHVQSHGFHFQNIHHFARCCREFRSYLHSERGNDLLQLLWKHYGDTKSNNAQCEGVLDFAPIGTPTGTGWHKFNETNRKHEPELDVYDYDIMNVSANSHLVKRCLKVSGKRKFNDVEPIETKFINEKRARPFSPDKSNLKWALGEFEGTALPRMAPHIKRLTGNEMSNVRLQKYARPNSRGAEYRILFTSTKQSHCCGLSNIEHKGNNIKLECSLFQSSKLFLGCHSQKRKECKGWKVVYSEDMSLSDSPNENEPTDIIPTSALKGGTHIILGVWTMKPFRLRLEGDYEDITNQTEKRDYFTFKNLPELCNGGEAYIAPEIRKRKASHKAEDYCYELKLKTKS